MAREFNINFNNVEMIDGMDNLLEDTQVTKVKFAGDNDLKSLKSTFKNCTQLTAIEGDVNLKEVVEIDCMLEGVQPLEINLANINKLESADDAVVNAQMIVIKGDSYKKEALQNLLASLDWASEQYIFDGTVGENVYTDSAIALGENDVFIPNSLELRNSGLEVLGDTYNNQLRNGDIVNNLKDYTVTKIEENTNEVVVNKEDTFVVEEIKGNTYHNLIEKNIANKLVEKKEYIVNDKNTSFLKDEERTLYNIVEIKGETIKNLNATSNRTFNTVPLWNKEVTEEDNSFSTDQPIVEITEIWGNTENIDEILHSVGELYIDKNGDPILDENGDFQYLLEIKINEEEIIPILLPQPLKSAGDVRDRIYWNYEEKCYYLEKNLEELILQGTESWVEIGELYATNTFFDLIQNNVQSTTLLSNRFKTKTINAIINNPESMCICYTHNYYGAYPNYDLSVTLPDENNPTEWFSKNPTTIIFELERKDNIKLSKLNSKIQLKTQSSTNMNVNSLAFPQKIILTNKQSIAYVSELNPNTQYSIHLKALGNTEENTITPSDLSLLSWTLGDYSNTSTSDITLSNVISVNANKGVTSASCSIDFSKLFDTLTTNNFQFSCDFRVNSLSSNNDKSIIIQGGYKNKGFEVKGEVLNAVTGRLTVTYNYSSQTYSIVSTGAMPINIENTSFGDIDIRNSFKIITQNCNVTYSNISLTTDNGICIGEGENKVPVLASLNVNLGGVATVIKPTFTNGYSEYIISITTSTLLNNNLELTGEGIYVKDIMVLEGQYDAYQEYFEGTKEIGEYKDEEYVLILTSNNYEEDWNNL